MELDALRRTIEILNSKLRPIADRPVEFGPDLLQRLMGLPDPLEEVGMREEGRSALTAAIDLYLQSGAEAREGIREIFRTNHAFAWGATLPFPPDTAERFRKHLVRFSIVDQGSDPRDAVLWLAELCAPSTGLDEDVVAAIRQEIAELSSNADPYGFGSTRDLILRGYGGYGRYGAPLRPP